MKVGDLVKVKNLPTSAFGIILEEKNNYWFLVYFFSLGYDMQFCESELEVANESRRFGKV